MKILVIEDDPTVGQFVKRGLEHSAMGVDLVADGEEGEQTAMAGSYDLVILDMRLPGKPAFRFSMDFARKDSSARFWLLQRRTQLTQKSKPLRAGAEIM